MEPERLQKAVQVLVDRHEALRTHFEDKDGCIMQVVEQEISIQVEQLDTDDISAFIRPFDLSKAPLLRVGYCENTVMVDMHHVITDGASMPIFLRELNELYMGRALGPAPVPYRQFAVEPPDYGDSEAYWLSVYSDELPVLELNTNFKREQKRDFSGSALYKSLDFALHQKILAASRKLGITPYVFYISGFYILLSKVSGNEDIVVGTPMSGRAGVYLDTIGMFVNTVALRGKPAGTKTVSEFLTEVKDLSVDAVAYQGYPYGELVKKLGANTTDRNPLFDVMFAYQDEAMADVVFGDKPAEILPIPVTTAKYDFTLNILPRKNDVVAIAEYCTDLYQESTLQRFIEGYTLVLEQMLNVSGLLKDISVITEQERQKLLFDFNNTTAEYPKDRSVYSLFEERANSDLNAVAVIDNGKHYSFHEFKTMAEKIDSTIQRLSKGEKQIIGIIADRSVAQLAAIFGIARGGNAYMPIATDYPTHRIEHILSQTSCNIVLAQREYNNKWKNTVCIEDILEKEIALPVPLSTATADDMLYVIFTSGSTGAPKGAAISNRSAVNRIYWMEKQYPLGKNGVVMLKTPYIFDVSVWEIFRWGMFSGCVYVLPPNEHYNPYSILSHIAAGQVTDMHFVPTMFSVFIDYLEQKSVNSNELSSLKNIFLSGEELKASLVNRFSVFNNGNIKLHNLYGPTECAVDVTYYDCKNTETDPIPIGKPINNTEIYIVDENMNILPGGSKGELCIGGDNVGIGYIQMPDLTAERFVDSPYGNGKLYKTGDLAYWREDGNIVYVGRNDFQVKIRGQRIELGEIENALQGVQGVLQAVVTVRKAEDERQIICAFYTGQETDGKVLRAAMGQSLPKYMLPHSFTHLAKLPLTSSGKVNRKALPEVDLSQIATTAEYIEPVGELEKQLAALMEQVLGYSPIGRDDDFFDLGGDSLKAIEFVSEAHSEGIYFALQNIFDHPTVQQLMEYIQSGDKQELLYSEADFTEINTVLEKNKLEYISTPQRADVGNILLAGATGYLGIHILADFIEHENGVAFCLVRGKDQADSKKRLTDLLNFYFGGRYLECDRIEVLCADLQKDNLGLTEQEYETIIPKISTVINAAASVKHYGSYQYFYEANVGTVKRLIEFCRVAGARLIHTSTISVSGNSFADEFTGYISETEKHFYESILYIGQPLDNVYARSKFEAEKVVLEAMRTGLEANILRMGNLSNRLSDGVFQKNHESNAALKRAKALLELGMIPDYIMDEYAEFTPIDEAARAVMIITQHFNTEQTVFHINSTKVVYLDKLCDYFTDLGYSIEIADSGKFATALRKTMEQSDTRYIFETFIQELDTNDRLNVDSNIRIKNDFTTQYLRRLGFEWSDIGIEYFRKYVQYFEKIGYLKNRGKL